jgi:pimeloyl-ACP methyl ester carboxylesterase
MKVFDHQSGKHVEIDGAKIYYEQTGHGNGHPLILLHGGLGNIEDFNSILPRLSQDFRVIGIDSRGHGKSTIGSTELSYERIERDLQQIIEHLQLDKFSIIGFSDGGIVSYRLASHTSSKIQKLVTIGSPWELKSDDPVRDVYSKVTGESWRKRFPATYDDYQKLNPQPNFDLLVQAVVKMWLDSSPPGYPGNAVSNISCDLLIVRGDGDHLVSMETVVELSRRVKNSRLLNIPFAGHVAFDDQPDSFMHALNEFIKTAA